MTNATRPAIRFPAQVDAVSIISRTPARVENESHSGIALAVAGSHALAIGQSVEIEYSGGAMPAVVRRTEQQPDGSWLIGLQWA